MEDMKSYPINYNHYYTDNVAKSRTAKRKKQLTQSINAATTHARMPGCNSTHTSASIDVDRVLSSYNEAISANMDKYSCESILDCVLAIYKVRQFIYQPLLPSPVRLIHRPQIGPPEDICGKYDNPSCRAPYCTRTREHYIPNRYQPAF
jgi:hypothetical protein